MVAVAPAEAGWASFSELARNRGVSVTAIKKKADRLLADGLIEVKPGPNNARLVNVEAFEAAAGRTRNAFQAANGAQGGSTVPKAGQAPPKPPLELSDKPILAEEQARRTQFQAELAKLELEKRQGLVIDRDEVVAAITVCGESIVRSLDQLPMRAEEVLTAAMDGGSAAVRAALKVIAADIRRSMAKALVRLSEDRLGGDAEGEEADRRQA